MDVEIIKRGHFHFGGKSGGFETRLKKEPGVWEGAPTKAESLGKFLLSHFKSGDTLTIDESRS